MKNVLIINGHPNSNSYNRALHHAYKNGMAATGNYNIDEIMVGEISFNPNLASGYSSGTYMEPDLLLAQEKIKKADHIVWIFPMWWGSVPAILKGFIDRVFVPGFAFKYHTTGSRWDKLLSGKTTEIICTTDYPVFILKMFFAEGGVKVMRKMILSFCGIKTIKTTYIGPIKPSAPQQREKWLKQVETLGATRKLK